jgi:SulP family sulfate permease
LGVVSASGGGIVVMLVMPKIIKIVPAPLVSVVIVAGVVLAFAISVPTVGNQGELPRSLPSLFIPNVPLI